MKTYKVKKGDSTLNLKAYVPSYATLDGNWYCTTKLLEDPNAESSVISKSGVRRGDNSAFDVYFTPAETGIETVKEGKTYYWETTMSNATLTPPYSKTITHKLEIEYKGG